MTLVRRIPGTKTPVRLDGAAAAVARALTEDQQALHDEALAQREERTVDVGTLDEAAEAGASGWARLPWERVGPDGEQQLAADGITVRCLLRPDGGVPESEDEANLVAIVGRAY